MVHLAKRIRVFVASPSDVQEERDSVAHVINELNLTLSALLPKEGAMLEFVRWETHAHPAAGDIQTSIHSQIGD
jgi:hypothetical protein